MKRLVKIFLWFAIALLLVPSAVNAQDSESIDQEIIMAVVQYRTELLERHPGSLLAVKMQMDSLKAWNISPSQMDFLFFNVNYYLQFGKHYPNIKVKDRINRHLRNHGFQFEFSEEGLQTLKKLSDLFDLIALDVLETDYPFKVPRESGFFQELSFYNFHDGEKIGEIGAGAGTFSLLLGIVYSDLDIYINEISEPVLDYIEKGIARCQSIRESNHFEVILGNNKSCKLEGLNPDKIIIRNSFHHFKKKAAMLQSVREALSDHGQLLIAENLRTTERQAGDCHLEMEKDELLKIILENGFVLLEQMQDEGVLYLRLEKG